MVENALQLVALRPADAVHLRTGNLRAGSYEERGLIFGGLLGKKRRRTSVALFDIVKCE